MSDLPIEILCEIFGNLSESLTDLSRISRCCRRFNSVVGPLLYKDFYLSFYFPEEQEISASIAALDGLERSDGWGGYVETFTVSGMDGFGQWDPRDSPGTMGVISPGILKALANMPKLRMFNWRIQSRFPAPEIIGMLGMLSVTCSLRDINLGFERDNDEPAYNSQPDDEDTGLVKLALGCRLPIPYAIANLQAIISCSPDIKVLRITDELCVDLFLGLDPLTDSIRPCILEINDPSGSYSPSVITSGPIDLRRCTNLTINTRYQTWLADLPISEIRKTQPEFLSKLKVLRFTSTTGCLYDGERPRFLDHLHGLEELSFTGRSIHHASHSGISHLDHLRAYAPVLRKLFIAACVEQHFFQSIPMYENLEDVGIEIRRFTRPPIIGLILQQLASLPNLKIFRILTDTQSDMIQSLVLYYISQSGTLSTWPALRFLCELDNDEQFVTGESDPKDISEVFMTVWERIRHDDGSLQWSEPVHVGGRVLVTEDWRAGLARYDDWDEWLRKRCAESDV